MAKTYKAKAFKMPNLGPFVTQEEIDQVEKDIEDLIKDQEDKDYSPFISCAGDNYGILIFKKDE